MNINKVILLGRVGKDPEVRYLQSGAAVASFSLATSRSYKNKEGQYVENTEWHNIVAWREQAELVEKYVKKGRELYIEGRLQTRSYEKDGITRYYTEIIASEIQLGHNPQSTAAEGSAANVPASTNQSRANQAQGATPSTVSEPMPEFERPGNEIEDDLPF